MNKDLFNVEDSINKDTCAISARNKQNNSISEYNVYNYFKGNTPDCEAYDKTSIMNLSLDTQMHIKDGYGIGNMCVVDTDSKLRNDAIWTNSKEKSQLYTRVFQGTPNINKGGLNVPIEDRVKQGEYNTIKKGCDRVSETQLDSFIPLVPCLAKNVQNTKHIIPEWGVWGGQPTRDFIHQKSFLEANGYVLDDKVWKKKYCN